MPDRRARPESRQMFERGRRRRPAVTSAWRGSPPSRYGSPGTGACATPTRNIRVEVPFPDGTSTKTVAQIVDRFHDELRARLHLPLDAPVEFVGVHIVATAEVGKLKPEPCRDRPRRSQRRRKGRRRASTTPTRASISADIYDGDRLEPGMELLRPGRRRDERDDDGVHPGNGRHRRVRQPPYPLAGPGLTP